jgi:phage-related protein
VLHAFQKKSKKGIATPQKDIELIRQRLAAVERITEKGRTENGNQDHHEAEFP